MEKGNFGCKDKRCNIHKYYLIDGIKDFSSNTTGKHYNINFNYHCDSVNVVYLITCKTCGKQYVGSTTTAIRHRFNQYISGVQRYGRGVRGLQQEGVFSHFFTEGHSGSPHQMELRIIDYCDPSDQERREGFWTFHLKTMEPHGLNDKLQRPKSQPRKQTKKLNLPVFDI